jgi:lipid-binding SYLF domain-containing protein
MADFLNRYLFETILTIKSTIMKKNGMVMLAVFAFATVFLPRSLKAQGDEDQLIKDSKEVRTAFIKADESMKSRFNNAYGYVIFPDIGKGAVVVGGAGGRGAVFEKGKTIGTAKMVQVTVGAQAGGQAYREVIFFENKDALDRFKDNKVEFSGQVSAVAVKSGASATAKYREGVAVFTQEKGGLMVEASVGGQKFTYKPL